MIINGWTQIRYLVYEEHLVIKLERYSIFRENRKNISRTYKYTIFFIRILLVQSCKLTQAFSTVSIVYNKVVKTTQF